MGRTAPEAASSARGVAVVLVAAGIGVVGALGGAYLGAHATITTQREQAQDTRRAKARTQRGKVYFRFLAAADAYEAGTQGAIDAVERFVTGSASTGQLRACARPSSRKCRSLIRRLRRSRLNRIPQCYADRRARRVCRALVPFITAYDNAQSRFQGALNQVYIYGSRPAVRATRKVAGSLPPSLYVGPQTFKFDFVDQDGFESGYNAMLDVMCREVPADSRSRCVE